MSGMGIVSFCCQSSKMVCFASIFLGLGVTAVARKQKRWIHCFSSFPCGFWCSQQRRGWCIPYRLTSSFVWARSPL
jgi:hypothetical protein